jgi:NADH:ubiquinone reductase (H+-translocating)
MPAHLASRETASMERPRVLIAGGGYVGLYSALALLKRMGGRVAITLVAPESHMTYQPFLPEAASGSIEPRHVVVPLRTVLKGVRIVNGLLKSIDHGARRATVEPIDGPAYDIPYDHLVLGLGSISRVLPVPGLAGHALGFKTLSDAIAVRNRALLNLEIAESLPDDESRREYLTFVFVGAGYAGVEGIAELQDYVIDSLDAYPRCRMAGTRWILVEALDRIMPEIPASLAEFASRELRRRGIELRTGTRLESMDDRSAVLSTGERLHTRTVCWTAGVKPPAIVRHLGVPLTDGGRIDVDATMRVKGLHNVWAIGDAAAVPDPAKRRTAPTPPTGQHAIRQGRVVAENVASALSGRKPRPFRYRTLGVFVDLGHNKAVATVLGVRLRGFPAWFAARTYHLAMMPGMARRVRLGIDWAVGLVFGRASAELGQLGHPPSLGDYLEEMPQSDEAPGR